MITLVLGPRSAQFTAQDKPLTPLLPLGPALLHAQWLHHAPPRPQELEAAIEAVEDLVMPLHRLLPTDDTLHVEAAERAALAPLAQAHTRDELEALFNRAAAIAQGRPASSDPALADPETVAALVLLREVMHHLGFTQLRIAPA
jgi:hypothetical protein